MPPERKVKKLIGETRDFYYLEDCLVVPKEEFLKGLNKSVLHSFSPDQPHSIVNEGNLSHLVSKLRDRRYSADRMENTLFVASELLYDIVTRHPFANGNKRTALTSCMILFAVNMLRHVNQFHPAGSGVKIVLPSYKNLKDAQLAEAIAAWNEERDVPELKESLAEKMKRLGFEIKEGKQPTEQQVKSFIKEFLKGIHARATVAQPQERRAITPQELIQIQKNLAFIAEQVFRMRKKSLEYLAKK